MTYFFKVRHSHYIKRGFTLIELLVVIAIISLLSSIALASFEGVRVKARNAQRLALVREYIIALEFVRDDIGQYPDSPFLSIWNGHCLGSYPGGVCVHPFYGTRNNATVDSLLEPYMPGLPTIVDMPAVSAAENYISGATYNCFLRTGGRCTSYQIFWTMEEDGGGECDSGFLWSSSGGLRHCGITR